MDNELLIRFIERRTSVEEAREVLRWIEANEQHRILFKQLQSVCASVEIDYASRTEKADAAEVKQIMSKVSRKHFKITTYVSVAACASVAAILLILFAPFAKVEMSEYEKALVNITNQKEITLTVHGDKKIELIDSSVTVAYNKKGEILVNDTAVTVSEKEENKSNLNTIYVPYGKRTTLLLADGSKVYLNSGSSLVYPADFTMDKREVYLEGEAYFEIAKESERQFIVQTAYKAVEVLGTKFNVSIDKSRNTFETVLVTGKIRLDSNSGQIELAPNQYYGYSFDSGNDELKTVDARNYISWIDGKLKVNREPLSVVLHKLEKSYNIEIEMLDFKYLTYEISGSLSLKNKPEETLDALMTILIPNNKSQKRKLYRIKSKE